MSTGIPKIILVVAYDNDRAIGKNNKLLWKLPPDMEHFKELTTGGHVLMGRKTWESLPARFRPLPERVNIVMTNQVDYNPSPAWKIMKPDHLRMMLGPRFNEPIFVIGGSQIYELFLPFASKIIATEIKLSHKHLEPDSYFPDFLPTGQWIAENVQKLDTFGGIESEVVTYVRESSAQNKRNCC